MDLIVIEGENQHKISNVVAYDYVDRDYIDDCLKDVSDKLKARVYKVLRDVLQFDYERVNAQIEQALEQNND